MTDERAPTRLDRRKAQTRAALVAAAQRFLAEGRSAVSVQELTDTADVGLGSFYNHFSTKDELFAEAVVATLEAWGELRDRAVAGLSDPAEIFARSFRMSGRLQRAHPELMRAVLNSGARVLTTDRGIRPRALADIAAGIEQDRFALPDTEIAVMAAGGALLGLLQLLDARPDLDDAAVSDVFTEGVLRMFGLDADEARRIASSTLPELPRLA